MNAPRLPHVVSKALLCAVAVFLAASQARAGATNTPPVKAAAQSTNDPNAELPIPQAVFEVLSKPSRDPFYPNSTRLAAQIASTNVAPFSAGSFTLRGLSGKGRNLLALINNRTLAVGEDAEVTTPTGKMKIHCVEIKEASVVITAESSPMAVEIFLRKSAQ